MKSDRRSFTVHAGIVSVGAALAISVACSRTDHPVERFASDNVVAGTGGGFGTAGSAPNAGTGTETGGKNSGGTGGSSGISGSGSSTSGSAGEGPELEVIQPPELDCGAPPVSTEPFTRQAMRAAAADCSQYHYCRFEGAASWLSETLTAHADEPSESTLQTARLAYAQALSVWSVLEHFQFGPLSSNATSSGKDEYQGKGIRERIYAWPLTARCRVEEQLVNQKYQTNMADVYVTGRGLFALDYLLYYPGADTECLGSTVTAKTWAGFSPDELTGRKLAYASALGADLHARISELQQTWAPEGGDYRAKLVSASGYPSEQDAMKVLGWALLYTEHEVKDLKLGVAAGVQASSEAEQSEGPYSGLGTEALRANLRGFRALYQGCGDQGEGLGFDDWLTEAGHPELAQDIVTAYTNAQAAAEAFPVWGQATHADFQALYATVKVLTDHLKNDLFGGGSPIGLDLPPTLSGDTD